ncbi:MAG: family 20 glycosylhydrolase [Paramuribaculum sp.]|nr:family 20 glycosylhydrolase [Paramuribaculum sp.]
MKIKSNILGVLCLCGFSAVSAQPNVNVTWQNQTNRLNENGKPEYVQRFIISGDLSKLKGIGFNQFEALLTPVNPKDKVTEIIPSYFLIESERFDSGADSIWVDIVTSGQWSNYSFGADGVHGVDKNDKPFDVNFSRLSATDRAEQYSLPGRDRMPYGDAIYAINERISGGKTPGRFDMLPSLKKVTDRGGINKTRSLPDVKIVKSPNPEYYRIEITPDRVEIEGASEKAVNLARVTLDKLREINGGVLPTGTIEDWPDYGYRGLMIDISRNWQSLDEMKKLVKLMADYKLNTLQFHLIDDEGWRLEIPGFPELTELGSRRGYTRDESEFLAQTYSGNGNPDASTFANGFISRADFIDFLKYCKELGIRVVPEVETPGHARAAIKAMEARYRRTGDDTYRLIEDGDTSKYSSAQDYHDNAMNPSVPGSYRFMNKIFDEIIAMYQEAGAELPSIHIGGDEVPHGAWSGSPSAQKMMAEKGLKTESQLHAYWAQEMANMLRGKGLQVSGWQDIAVDKDTVFSKKLIPDIEFVNLWVTWKRGDETETPAERSQRLGIPIVLSSAHGYYFDMAYDWHPDERGLTWSGVTDEFLSFNTYPSVMAPKENGGSVVGVQGQLWSETVRGPEWLEYYLFPKMLGMVERSWNGDTTYTEQDYNQIIDLVEMPFLDGRDTNYRIRQAGIKKGADGKIMMNSPYRDATIRYTTDGSEPSPESAVYSKPIDVPNGTKTIKAKLFHRGKESVSSILRL